jgi:hypothetical protein
MARRFQEDDDDDDRPRRRRPADDDDDDVDERISSRRGAGARARRDDYDDEDDYDRPRKKKKAGSKGLIIGLSVGGGVLLLAGIGILLFFVLKGGSTGDTQKLLVGTWQVKGSIPAWRSLVPVKVQFTADGSLIKDMGGGVKWNYKYKVINASTIEIEVDLRPAGGFGEFLPKMKGIPELKMRDVNMNIKQNITVKVTQNELTMPENHLITEYKRVN